MVCAGARTWQGHQGAGRGASARRACALMRLSRCLCLCLSSNLFGSRVLVRPRKGWFLKVLWYVVGHELKSSKRRTSEHWASVCEQNNLHGVNPQTSTSQKPVKPGFPASAPCAETHHPFIASVRCHHLSILPASCSRISLVSVPSSQTIARSQLRCHLVPSRHPPAPDPIPPYSCDIPSFPSYRHPSHPPNTSHLPRTANPTQSSAI